MLLLCSGTITVRLTLLHRLLVMILSLWCCDPCIAAAAVLGQICRLVMRISTPVSIATRWCTITARFHRATLGPSLVLFGVRLNRQTSQSRSERSTAGSIAATTPTCCRAAPSGLCRTTH